jgi:hypothetical protein
MKIEILGFKGDMVRPTANRTMDLRNPELVYGKMIPTLTLFGRVIEEIMDKSDFINIRRVNDK